MRCSFKRHVLHGLLLLLLQITFAASFAADTETDLKDHSPLEGWHKGNTGSWIRHPLYKNTNVLTALTLEEDEMFETNARLINAGGDYRLDAWIRCKEGGATLGVDILDPEGKRVTRHWTPTIQASSPWCYIAKEFHAPDKTSNQSPLSFSKSNPICAKVWLRLKGEAELKDIHLVPLASSFIGNKGLEPDQRGRIGFWSEEKNDTLLKGHRAGEIRPDNKVQHEGKSSALLIPKGDWVALSSINYGLPSWTDRYELSIWARCESNATATLLACWTDEQQKVLGLVQAPALRGANWQRTSVTMTAPANAAALRLVAAAQGGSVWFDEADLVRLAPQQRRARIFVNQIGYEQPGPKNAVIAANFYPENGVARFKIISPSGDLIWKGNFRCAGRVHNGSADDWGWFFWRADFSQCRTSGNFRARVQLDQTAEESLPFEISDGILLHETAESAVNFFYIQRCGCDVPGWHKACHLDDAKLPDGTHLDATGGWHSAGDYNKLMYEHGDGGVVFALLKALENSPKFFNRHPRNSNAMADALDEALWGAQFVSKMQIPETGGLRNSISQGPGREWTKWSPPETHTDNLLGTSDDPVIQAGEGNSPLVIGGWARLSVLLEKKGQRNDYLRSAVRLWEHTTRNGSAVANAYLLLSSIDLENITGESRYFEYARRSAQELLGQQVTTGPLNGAFGTYGESSAAALASFALRYPDDSLIPIIKQSLVRYLQFCLRQGNNPFGLTPQSAGEKVQFFPADLGNNFQILSRAWAAALSYQVTRDPAALVFAMDQIDWVLGKNPYDLCMFEGKGAKNPPRYHHRYNSIPGHERGAVPGAIPNGFVRELGLADRPGFDMSIGGNRSPSFRTSEPWLVHNMFYLLAVGELQKALHLNP